MKILKQIFTIVFLLGLLVSCSEDEALEKSDSSSSTYNSKKTQAEFAVFDENEIGIIDEETGKFISITGQELENYYSEIFDFDFGAIAEIHLVEEHPDDSDEPIYYLSSYNENFTANLTTGLTFHSDQNFYTLDRGSCTCTSTDCGGKGACEAKKVEGSSCKCTGCENKCTKTSTATTDLSLYFKAG